MAKINIPEELIGYYIICNTLSEWQTAILIIMTYMDSPINSCLENFRFDNPKYIRFDSETNFNHSSVINLNKYTPSSYKQYPLDIFLSKF